MKNYSLNILLLVSSLVFSQVSVNKQTTNSTLDVLGSMSVKYEDVTANKTLGINDHFINYIYSSATAPSTSHVITLPSDDVLGRIYYIKNSSNYVVSVTATNSQTLRIGNAAGVTSFNVQPGYMYKFIRTNNSTTNAWETTRTSNPISTVAKNVLYATQVKIPPFDLALNQYINYSINNWKLIGINPTVGDRVRGDNQPTSGGRATIGFKASKMDLTYEFQGVKIKTKKIYPIITAGNSNTAGITLIPSFAKIINNANGKTELKISVARTDLFGMDGGDNDLGIQYISKWTDTNAFLNVLIATQIN